MKLEYGKKYVNGEGAVFGPLTPNLVDDGGRETHPFTDGTDDLANVWTADGAYWDDGKPCGLDLVAEYVPFSSASCPPSGSSYIVQVQTGDPYVGAADEALAEVHRAKALWPNNFVNAHEGYAILLEELDELWEHVKTNQKRRDLIDMRKEAIQVAAMALRFAVEVTDEINGRK